MADTHHIENIMLAITQ